MTLDAAALAEARKARDRLLELQHEVDRTRSDYHHTIRRLHAAGASMREIAEELGLSHQRVHQIVDSLAGGPSQLPFPPPGPFEFFIGPHGPKRARLLKDPLARFTEEARELVLLAEDEARALRHRRVGAEHLLLAAARQKDSVAGRALGALGLVEDEVRAEAGARGRASEKLPSRLSFARDAKEALELSLHEALEAGQESIGPEHVVLALARDADSTAAEILEAKGLDGEHVRAEILRLLDLS